MRRIFDSESGHVYSGGMATADNDDAPRPSGQQSKGKRGFISVRPPLEPVDHVAVYQARADALGLALGEYCVKVLAETHGLPVPSYITDALEKAPTARERARKREERRTGKQPLEFPVDVERSQPLARSA